MKPTKIWSNLAVSDLEQTTKFYTALGFKPNGRSQDLTSFLFGGNEFIMHFFLKEVIEANTKIKFSVSEPASEVLYTLYASTREDVDAWAKEVEPAGGNIISAPEEFGKGYYGFVFADPDGHKFNVFHM